MQLQDYITRTTRLLHDTTFTYWTQQEIIDYINEARGTVAYQTQCLRGSYITTVPQNTGEMPYPPNCIDVISLFLTLNNYTYSPDRVPYSIFRQRAYNPTMIGRPVIWSTVNPTIYLFPNTDQQYQVELFCSFAPTPLVNLTDTDNIPIPFTDLIPYYASYLANLYAQRMDKAALYLQMYNDRRQQVMTAGNRIRKV